MDAVKKTKQQGFTLLEILLVVLVIGMGLAIAVPRLMPDKKAEAQRAALAIAQALERARDEAVFSGHTIAVQFNANKLSYEERDASNVKSNATSSVTNNASGWEVSNRAGLADMALPDNTLLRAIEIEINQGSETNPSAPTNANTNAIASANPVNAAATLPRLVFQPAGFGAPATVVLKFIESQHRIVISPIGAVVLDPALKVAENAR